MTRYGHTRRDHRDQQVRNRLQHARWQTSPPLRFSFEALTVTLWLGLFAVLALFLAAVAS